MRWALERTAAQLLARWSTGRASRRCGRCPTARLVEERGQRHLPSRRHQGPQLVDLGGPPARHREVEHRAHRLARRAAQSPAELLQEQHRAVRGAQQQQRGDHGDVDALVEQVDREDHLHPPVGQVTQRRLALDGRAVGPHRTFHSSPSTCAEWVRFDDPMYAVECPDRRWNSHAFACNRVVAVSYDTRTSAPNAASSSNARRSVDPVYVVVSTLRGTGSPERSQWRRSASSSGRMPLRPMFARPRRSGPAYSPPRPTPDCPPEAHRGRSSAASCPAAG